MKAGYLVFVGLYFLGMMIVKYEQDKPIDSGGESPIPVFRKSKAGSVSTTQQRM